MNKLKSYIGLAIIGGLLAILPMAVFILAGRWLLRILGRLVSPISDPITAAFELSPLLSDFLVIVAFLVACLLIGLLVRTALARWLHNTFDHWMSKLAPGYKTIRTMTHQLIGGAAEGHLEAKLY